MSDTNNPYLEQMRGHDDHETALQHAKRDRGITAIGLFVLLAGSVYGNLYQMQQVKEIHHLTQVDEHGRVVSSLLRRTDQIPASDPLKVIMLQRYISDQVKDWRARPLDKQFLAVSLNTALQRTAGPAGGKFETALEKESPFARIKNERVEVKLKGIPIALTPSVWQAEWWENVTDASGRPVRTDLFTGRFQLAEKPEWVTPDNVFGVRIVDWGVDQLHAQGE